MQTNLLAKYFFSLLFGCFVKPATAQFSFQYKAELEAVPNTGFYEIVLLPSVTAKLQPGFRDIRIIDAGGHQVPYMLRTDVQFPANYTAMNELPILSRKKESDKLTHVVLRNDLGKSISSLVLFIKNTEANRYVTIAGSDNNSEWYVIKELVALNNLFTDSSESVAHELKFPNSSYQYFKLIIHGTEVLPFNIIKVYTSGHSMNPGTNYLAIPSPIIRQVDSSDQFSYVTIRFNDFYSINKLDLKVSGGRLFRRPFDIYRNNVLLNIDGPLFIHSNAPLSYPVDVKTKELLLKIKNEDNPPLLISEVSAFQLKSYLVTWLEKGAGYKIVFGDSTARAPVYDLEFFKDSIQHVPSSLQFKTPERNSVAKLNAPIRTDSNKAVMWSVIAVVLAILLFVTFRLTKEISKRE